MDDALEEVPDTFTIAGMSWVILGEAVESMPALFVSGIVAYGIVSLAEWQFQETISSLANGIGDPGLRQIAGLVALLPFFTLHAIVLAAIAVPIHRLVLRDEKADSPVKLLSRSTFRFAGWLVAVQFSYLVLLLPLTLLSYVSHAAVLLAFVAVVAALIFIFFAETRLSLLFPCVALDLPSKGPLDRLRQAWVLSQGCFWRILGSTLIAAIPLAVAAAIIGWAVFALLTGLGTVDETAHTVWWNVLVATLSRPFAAALGAAALSWNYRFALVTRERLAAPDPSPAT